MNRFLPVLLLVAVAVALAPSAASAQIRSATVSGAKVGPGGTPSGTVRVVHKGEDFEADQIVMKVYEWGARPVGEYFGFASNGGTDVHTELIPLSAFRRADGTAMRLKRYTLYVVQADALGGGAGIYYTYPIFTAFFTL